MKVATHKGVQIVKFQTSWDGNLLEMQIISPTPMYRLKYIFQEMPMHTKV